MSFQLVLISMTLNDVARPKAQLFPLPENHPPEIRHSRWSVDVSDAQIVHGASDP